MRFIVVLCALLFSTSQVGAQVDRMNFKDRQAVIIDTAPGMVELSAFSFRNEFANSRFRLSTDLEWTNTSEKPITAFEIVVLRYDPFNRPIRSGGRWLITGKNSGDWSPLMPKEKSGDGLNAFNNEPVLTSIAYVRAIRFSDGNV